MVAFSILSTASIQTLTIASRRSSAVASPIWYFSSISSTRLCASSRIRGFSGGMRQSVTAMVSPERVMTSSARSLSWSNSSTVRSSPKRW